jgi:hypothetical protein
MALVSPGVEVTIVDQSQYLPAPTNSIPFILLATAQNKANPTGTGVAAATTAANANKLFLVTSQRDLVTLYGNPFFYTTTDGTPIQGYELNEYGLLAAYSALGVTNQVYCLRADIDLAALVGSVGRPSSDPDDGTWWLDSTTSTWGIFEWNAATQSFAIQSPIVITDDTDMSGNLPASTVGAVGDYAVYANVNADGIPGVPTAASSKEFFYKSAGNGWVSIGSAGASGWLSEVPTMVGNASYPALTISSSFDITIGNDETGDIQTATITSANANISSVVASINSLNWSVLSATTSTAGRLQIFSKQLGDEHSPAYITISPNGDELAVELGLTSSNSANVQMYQPTVAYGTSAQAPLWQSTGTQPRPTGSIWMKVGSAGNGISPVMSQFSTQTGTWIAKTVNMATSDWSVTSALDASGGKAIPQNTVYAQYGFFNGFNDGDPNFSASYNQGPVYFYERIATGPTVVTGIETNANVICPAGNVYVQTSIPGSNTLSSIYTVQVSANANVDTFVTNWQAAGIPNTTATKTTSNAVQITHTSGGEILLSDYESGNSFGILTEVGLVPITTAGCKYGPSEVFTFQVTDSGNCEVEITTAYGNYYIGNILNGGAGYTANTSITFAGTIFGGATPANDLVLSVAEVSGNVVTSLRYESGEAEYAYTTLLSNWYPFEYTVNEIAPVESPVTGTNWFYSTVSQVDIMVNTTGGWVGYQNIGYDFNGFPQASITNATDPNGPIISASEPTIQSEGDPLAYGDLWIDTSDLENYPVISRWQSVNSEDKWVLINNADQVDSNGIVFADARWATSGTVNPITDAIPSITSLLVSNYLDLDAPATALYPTGMLLFNTRRSGYNVKQYVVNYFNSTDFPDQTLPTVKNAWVSDSGLQFNGAPYMGRKAQRAVVVQALRASIDTNLNIRDEDNFFNLIACPNYPELQPNMVVLNSDRGETGYILGDTPLRLPDQATAIQAWATNAAGAEATGEAGCVTRNTYLGLFYPSGLAPDLAGNLVAVPPSHMMLRTFLRNDTVAFPWFAAAGTRRGIIDNATNIGYLDATTGEFITTKTRIGIRDVLYTNFINPLVFFTGNGLLNYGNKTSFNSQSALDRTNVARLIAYIRRQLTISARPFVFEPNDAITRAQIAGVVESLMVDLVAKRGIYDYLVVCDESNNTPARIDRNELWIDVAIEPVKAAEFIYIPVRILNTGELSGA